jgi:PHD/YefM family antitoxin component YafN of YafNO toxin-antitoxin module
MNEIRTHNAKDFESNAEHLLHVARDSGEVIEITEDGQESVFMFQANREHLLSLMEDMQIREGIRAGLDDVKAGRIHSIEEVFSEYKKP